MAAANGLTRGERRELDRLIASSDPRTLNRVINLETGSLVVEAALKMVLARFHRSEKSAAEPRYAGPHAGAARDGRSRGRHRGQLPRHHHADAGDAGPVARPGAKLESSGAMLVRPVRINDVADFERVLRQWDAPPHKVAAFFHEIVLMNYGAVRLEEAYLRRAYALCREHDVPVVADEIQSCVWSPELFLFREYGLAPDLVSVGKGFPGGEYPAARVIGCPGVDTPRPVRRPGHQRAGGDRLARLPRHRGVRAGERRAGCAGVGELYEEDARRPRRRGTRRCSRGGRACGTSRRCSSTTPRRRRAFAAALNAEGIDISVQSYKANCPPSCLTKLPAHRDAPRPSSSWPGDGRGAARHC